MVLPGNARVARGDAGGDDDVLKPVVQVSRAHPRTQLQHHAGGVEAALEVTQHLVEFFFARHLPGQVELAADGGRGIEQRDRVAALGQVDGGGHARRPGTHHGHALFGHHGAEHQLGFAAGAGVDQAAGHLVLEHMIQAGLVAGNAGVDQVGLARSGLGHKPGIGQQRAGQRHHVGHAVGQNVFGHLGRVDAVAGDQRRGDARRRKLGLHLGRDPGKRRARHAGGDGGHPRLVPADAGVDDGGPALRHGLAQLHHLVPSAAIGHQVDHGQAVDQREVFAHGLAGAGHDFQRQLHALGVVAAPAVGALVGVAGQKLVDEVTLGAHDFHAVIPRLAGLGRAVDEGANLPLHATGRQLPRLERRNGGLQAARCHRQRVVGIAPGVQNLQRNLAARLVDGIGHHPVAFGRAAGGQRARKRLGPARDVGRKAAGHDQAHTALGPLAEVGGQPAQVSPLFQAGVHGAHQHPVFERGVAQVQRLEQVGVRGGGCGGGGLHGGRVHVAPVALKQARQPRGKRPRAVEAAPYVCRGADTRATAPQRTARFRSSRRFQAG